MQRSIVFTPRDPVLPGGIFLNCVCLLAVSCCLGVPLYYQWVLMEPTCPLCLLQRTGVILTGIGFMRNLRFGVKSAHYGVALGGAVLTGLVALRQLSLEGLPGQQAQGAMLLGLHFYSWYALFALTAVLIIAGLLGFKSAEYPGTLLLLQTEEQPEDNRRLPWARIITCLLFVAVVAAHLVSSVSGCDPTLCDEDLIDRLQLHALGQRARP